MCAHANTKTIVLLLLVSVTILLAGLTVLLVINSGNGGSSSSDSSSWVPFLPIWCCIFLPILIAQQNKEQKAKHSLENRKSSASPPSFSRTSSEYYTAVPTEIVPRFDQIYCSHCASANPPDSCFCTFCGTRID